LRQILKNDWKLKNQDNSRTYQKMVMWTNGLAPIPGKGRYYTIEKSFLLGNFEDLENDETMQK
jgi:hypothetical protein